MTLVAYQFLGQAKLMCKPESETPRSSGSELPAIVSFAHSYYKHDLWAAHTEYIYKQAPPEFRPNFLANRFPRSSLQRISRTSGGPKQTKKNAIQQILLSLVRSPKILMDHPKSVRRLGRRKV